VRHIAAATIVGEPMLAYVEILLAHVRDLARALPGHEDHAQRASLDQANIVKRIPDQRQLSLGEDTLARLRRVALNTVTGVALDVRNVVLHGPREDRRPGRENLIGQHRRAAVSQRVEDAANLGAGNVSTMEVAPSGDKVSPHQGVSLSPGFVAALGVLLDIAMSQFLEGRLPARCRPLSLYVNPAPDGCPLLAGNLACLFQTNPGYAPDGEPPRTPSHGIDELVRLMPGWFDTQDQTLLHGIPIEGPFLGWLDGFYEAVVEAITVGRRLRSILNGHEQGIIFS
jgi:hypothetical protein